MTAKEYLRQAYRLNKKIEADHRDLASLESLSASLPSLDLCSDVIVSGGHSDKVADIVERKFELGDLIKSEIIALLKLKADIFKKVNAIKNDDYRLILQMRYISLMKWEEIAVDTGYTYRNVLKIHAKALANFESVHCFSLLTCDIV